MRGGRVQTAEHSLTDLLDLAQVQRVCNGLSAAGGLSAAVLDPDGTVLVTAGWQDICTRFHRVHEVTLKGCLESDACVNRRLLDGLSAPGYASYTCANGLRDVAAPVVIAGEHVATLIIGQFFCDDDVVDEAAFRRRAQRLGFDERAYLDALAGVPVLSPERVERALGLLADFVDMLGDLGRSALRLAREHEALRGSEARCRSVLRASPDGIAITDLEGRVREASPAALSMFGYDRDGGIIGRSLGELLVTEGAERPEAGERPKVSVALEFQGMMPGPGDCRGLRADGSTFAAEVSGELIHDAHEQPAGMVFNVRDVTRRKQIEEELRETRDYIENLFGYANAPIIVWDPQQRITRFNRAFEELTGRAAGEVVGRHLELLFPADERRTQTLDLVTRASAGDLWEVVEVPILRADREVRTVLWSAAVLYGADGTTPVATIAQGQDITERKRTEEELAHLNDELRSETAALAQANATITRIAAVDDLTGLANRRHFYEALERAISLVRRHGGALSLLSLDLDGLKRVNDSAGHKAGDEVLTSFAALLGSVCRVEDLPGRLGGDEFSVLLPHTDQSGALGLAERVLTAVRSCEALAQRGVTVSGGVAQWTSGELPADLLRRADRALYVAKQSGRDTVALDG